MNDSNLLYLISFSIKSMIDVEQRMIRGDMICSEPIISGDGSFLNGECQLSDQRVRGQMFRKA